MDHHYRRIRFCPQFHGVLISETNIVVLHNDLKTLVIVTLHIQVTMYRHRPGGCVPDPQSPGERTPLCPLMLKGHFTVFYIKF